MRHRSVGKRELRAILRGWAAHRGQQPCVAVGIARHRQTAPDAVADHAVQCVVTEPGRLVERRLVVGATQVIGVHQVDDGFLRAVRHDVAIAPAEEDGTRRAQIEILLLDVAPVHRQVVIDQLERVEREAQHGV